MTERIIRRAETKKKVGLGYTKIYELIKKGKFPPPIQLTPRCVGWLESEIDEWIAERVAETRKAGFSQ